MHPDDFDFALPDALIARQPAAARTASRLLQLSADGTRGDRHFSDLPGLLTPGDLLVLNDTRVIPARLFGRKASGGKAELLIERVDGARHAWAQVRASKSPKAGGVIHIVDASDTVQAHATVAGREGRFFSLGFDADVAVVLDACGHMPLPPYIDRADTTADRERYQTVYARHPGAVAAPTAGLHFDDALFETLEAQGVQRAFVTLHVAAGTFQPLDDAALEAGELHAEWLQVSDAVCDAVAATRERGGRVIAVGTTSLRALETAAASGRLAPFTGDTRLFIQPGYRFRVVDGLITNFHLPKSSLMMLVAALGGRDRILEAYAHAVREQYRFFSYGDAMLIWPSEPSA
ncbi:MAG: tRNA preQ1(34) S-adenosylmethionine ribosyltransferase-isomerase QueA [Pseudomonadota bacterium]